MYSESFAARAAWLFMLFKETIAELGWVCGIEILEIRLTCNKTLHPPTYLGITRNTR